MCERSHTHDHHSPPLLQPPQAQIFHKRHGIYTHVLDVAMEDTKNMSWSENSAPLHVQRLLSISGFLDPRVLEYTHSRIRDSYAKARGIARLIGSSPGTFRFPDALRILRDELTFQRSRRVTRRTWRRKILNRTFADVIAGLSETELVASNNPCWKAQ